MATATDIAKGALRRLGIVQAGATASAVDVADAVKALDAMIASWAADGLEGYSLPIDAKFEQGVTAMLALRLAEDYGVPIGPKLAKDADDGWRQLQAAFIPVPDATYDYALTRTPSRRLPDYEIE